MYKHVLAHAQHTICRWTQMFNKPNFPYWPCCHAASIPSEKLLVNVTNVFFWLLKLLFTWNPHHTLSYQADVCMYRVKHACMLHLTITQHTVSFLLLAAGKLAVLYIFSYADGHITGVGILLKWFVVLIWRRWSAGSHWAPTHLGLESLMLYS